MGDLTYKRLLTEEDIDIPYLRTIYQLPEIARYISIDETNIASINLFEEAGFIRVSKEDELINFVYQRRKTFEAKVNI